MAPKNVVVGTLTYSVGVAPTLLEWGFIDYRAQKIVLADDAEVERRRITLLHEVLHACTEQVNLKDNDDEETFVSRVSPLLLQVLRENPDLVAYLTRED